MTEKRSIDDLITDWKYSVGQEKTSSQGTTYVVIPIADRRGCLLDLIQTLVDAGVTEDDLKSGVTSSKVVKTCWSDLITKMTAKELAKARAITRGQWEEAIREFLAKPISKYAGEKPLAPAAPEPKKAPKTLEVVPTDRLVMDTSDMAEAPLDLDFLEELGLEESDIVSGNE
jgi:hypothetical protein